jgi:hypothetical protein
MIIRQFRYNLSKFVVLWFCYIFPTNGIADDFNEDYKQPNRGLKAAQFMPINRPNIRIKIPQFKDGKLDCVIRAEKMTRITEDDIDLKGMNIDFYDDSNKEMRVYFKSATYSLMRNKVKSKEVTKVSRPNFFTLTGESIEFDVDKRQGRMIGKVRMVLHGSDKLVRSSDREDLYIGASKPFRFPVLSAVRLMSEAIQKGKENSEK